MTPAATLVLAYALCIAATAAVGTASYVLVRSAGRKSAKRADEGSLGNFRGGGDNN